MEDRIKQIIELTLNIPTFLDGDTILFPGATISLSQRPQIHGDGKGLHYTSNIDINLYYIDRSARDEAVNLLLQAFDSIEGATSPSVEKYYDTTAKNTRLS